MLLTYKEQLSKSKEQNYIPEEIYVGKSSRGADEIVGFMIPYIPGDSTYEKKKAAVDKWASKNTTPGTFLNEFSNGYSIIKQVRRYESDAVYWRVLHPQGFEFEISLGNFEYLMENHVIDQGILVNSDHTNPAAFKLVQQRSNRKWIMVDAQHPEYTGSLATLIPGSDEFKALEKAVTDEAKSFNAELQIGDVVEFSGYSYGKYEYVGIFTLGYLQHSKKSDDLRYERKKVFKRLDCRYSSTISYETFSSSKKVSKIITAATHEKTIDESIAEIKDVLRTGSALGQMATFDDRSAKPVGIWAKKPKKKELVISYKEVQTSEFSGTTMNDMVGPVTFHMNSNVAIKHQSGYFFTVTQYIDLHSFRSSNLRVQCQYLDENYDYVISDLLIRLTYSDHLSWEYGELARHARGLRQEPTSIEKQQLYDTSKKRYDDAIALSLPEGIYLGEHIAAIYIISVD